MVGDTSSERSSCQHPHPLDGYGDAARHGCSGGRHAARDARRRTRLTFVRSEAGVVVQYEVDYRHTHQRPAQPSQCAAHRPDRHRRTAGCRGAADTTRDVDDPPGGGDAGDDACGGVGCVQHAREVVEVSFIPGVRRVWGVG